MNYALAFVGQLILYLFLMLFDEYFGTLLALLVGSIALAVWCLSYLVEWVQASRVSPAYYRYLLTCWMAPLVALTGFILLRGGIGWL
ncbi:inner membrane protein involved in colicin E2 resistance [Lewinella marina]|uniref:Uncharacterized protein n=1 Tax=Neolewinella marina TaxID=438751 RepID=A0A2G0CFM2_9BACT|nr:hypothetical protein [Neolewinella marina]NJB85534.1 inner membrane protein involved in colicin E2 resistance [Neolewinella marina]PHK98778.1 hypothetical protein CGL56_09960 [Neolewinella marina]